MSELNHLFAAVPQLTRLTFQHPTKETGNLDWEAVGLALFKTPHVNYIDCYGCGLEDVDLLRILAGCTLELCELRLGKNPLQFRNNELIRRLQYFTNLQ